jgi:N-acetylneuraminate synthase
MEFTEEQWSGLRRHADERSLHFLSSPFSVEAAQLLHRVGVPAWKIPSGEINNGLLLDFILGTRLPVLLSTGMSSLEEIDRVVSTIQGNGVTLALMQCTSKYPCAPHEVGLNILPYFRERYSTPVGLSDHSGTIYPSLASAALGAEVIEVHVTLSRESFGPDVPASVTTGELRQIADGVRFITEMLAAPVDKQAAADEMAGMRKLFMKSIVAARDLPAGTVVALSDLGLRKPGTGIPADRIDSVIGRRLRCALRPGEFLSEANLEMEMAVVETP